MTDLEYGRAWAAQQGRRPAENYGPGMFAWLQFGYEHAGRFPDAVLPYPLASVCGYPGKDSEDAAYAVLGYAVRRIHAQVPPLRDPTG